MRFIHLQLVAILVAQIGAWAPIVSKSRLTSRIQIRAISTPTDSTSSSTAPDDSSDHNSSIKKASHGLEIGRILEGGKVIDFSSVKASSRAEHALAEARQRLDDGALIHSGDVILGINQDVIAEVGHPLGSFATAKEVQDCGAYIRSKAPGDLFEPTNRSIYLNGLSKDAVQRFERILAQAYEESGEVTGAFAKTFYMGTMLLGPEARQAIWAIYVWCRRTDEIVDAPRDNEDDMLLDLSSWELRLENLWRYGDVVDVYDLCFTGCTNQIPNFRYPTFYGYDSGDVNGCSWSRTRAL